MNYNEMKQAVKLLSNEWNLGKKRSTSRYGYLCLDIFI